MPEIAEIAGVDAEALELMPRADIEKLLLKAVAMAWIRHQKIVGSPLALKNQGDSLWLRIADHHQRGEARWHKVFSGSSTKLRLQPPG